MEQEKSTKPPCIIAGCTKKTYGGSRGMCPSHYAVRQALVKRGSTTWEELEEIGQAKPRLTPEEYGVLRRKSRSMKRVWSSTLSQWISVKRTTD